MAKKRAKDIEAIDEPSADADTPQKTKPGSRNTGRRVSAETMAKTQRSISVSEFFAKNRHLLGFDNPRKALLTTVKEATDNSLDACEEAGILPVIEISVEQLGDTHYKVTVRDNGPGIVRQQIPHIFGRLLYGSKFHRLRMSRGQQGIGISAAGMYGLLTTGKPVRITSRTSSRSPAQYYELQINTRKNRPDIIRQAKVDWEFPRGTQVEIELEARYQKGRASVDDYLQQTAVANPHVTLVYNAPDGRCERYEAPSKHLPPLPKEIRPHPQGVEVGLLIKMLEETRSKRVSQFLTNEFSRVSSRVAQEILDNAGVSPSAKPTSLTGQDAQRIYKAIQKTKIMAPSTDCVVPIGKEQLIAGLKQVVQAEFYAGATRKPAVYRGNPFIVEAALAYGRAPKGDASTRDETSVEAIDEGEEDRPNGEPLAKLIRFANRVPLLYQQSACATTKAVVNLNWKAYNLSQSRGALPSGDLTVVVHIASVWVPFTSESKEAIASYPEILKEIRLALQEIGRLLGIHLRKRARMQHELKKRSYIEKYIPAIGQALQEILDLNERDVTKACENLKTVLERSRRM